MKSKRNGEIDLLRFIFAVVIVFFHFNVNYDVGLFQYGYIGVEFFFVVTGYLMAGHVYRMNADSRDLGCIADETWRYILKKTRSFYSYYFFAILLQAVVRYLLLKGTSLTLLADKTLRSIPVFTLSFLGLDRGASSLYVSNTWYLSAMLLSIFLLYPLLLRHYKFSVEILFPILSLFLLGYLYSTYKTIRGWEKWAGFVYFGMLRAVPEIAMGASLFQLSNTAAIKESPILRSEKLLMKGLVTACKLFCYAVVLAFAQGSAFKENFNLHALLFCALGVMLSFSGAGYCIPDSKLTRYLGKISLPIFTFHGVIRLTLWDHIGHKLPMPQYLALTVGTIIACVALMYVTDFLSTKLKQAAKKIV